MVLKMIFASAIYKELMESVAESENRKNLQHGETLFKESQKSMEHLIAVRTVSEVPPYRNKALIRGYSQPFLPKG